MAHPIYEDSYYTDHLHDNLVMHAKRPQWGVAMLTWEGDDRRRYQFQDGRLRTFKDGFYHFFEPVEASAAAQQTLREDLERKHGMSLQDREAARSTKRTRPVMSFEQQLRVFKHIYPGNFQDEEYVSSFRFREGRTRLKRLVDPVIALAQATFAEDKLSKRIADSDWDGFRADVLSVLKRTSLASPTKVVQPLKEMDDEHLPRLANAMFQLLYGDPEVKYKARFREWVMALDAQGTVAVTWPMATVIPALVQPEQHVCVRRKAFRLQAREVAPDARIGKHPSPRAYKSAARVGRKTLKKLRKAGLEPRDLFDVRLFIWETLRPKGQEILSEVT